MSESKIIAVKAQQDRQTAVEEAEDYVENFDILETITNVGNDEVFTPVRIAKKILDSLPDEVWHNPNYKWLNPCTKNGVFEREIAIRLNEGLKDIITDEETRKKHILQDMIYAIGLTKFCSHVARRTLYYCSQANKKCDGIKASDGHFVNGYAIGNGTWFDDEEGNIKTPCTNHKFIKEGKEKKCEFCGINEKSKYNDPLQREQYAYEFIHVDQLNLKRHLQDRFFGGNSNMKFDIIIGNPPYQLSDGGAQASARPIYQLFIQKAKSLNPKYLCMIVPSRWMTGGKGLDDFRDEMINDKRIVKLYDFEDGKEIFPAVEIKGGVCFFLRERDYSGQCTVFRTSSGKTFVSKRFLKEDGTDVYIRDERLIPILNKVKSLSEPSFSKLVSPLKPYGLRGDFFKDPKKYNLPNISLSPINGGYSIYGLDGLKRVVRYIPKEYPLPKKNNLDKFKLFMARNQGSGIMGEKFSDPIFAKPGELCTETFVTIGGFNSENEMINAWSYMKTKFFRALVATRKQDQNAAQSIYLYVPIQDFSKPWTDEELFKKYKLDDEDIDFINNNIQEMN